ncbi:hypothetical protein B0H14DRAFT_3170872 [Mycena olivaceomarginata]|nr:hypothetical protein B0H14DRAFT_3170872 [Mycena olivaceomarginata]
MQRAGVECVAGERGGGAAVRSQSAGGGRGGGGEGALGAGSEREKGAAEGGWGLRGCSLGPLRWITAGDPFLYPEYVQATGMIHEHPEARSEQRQQRGRSPRAGMNFGAGQVNGQQRASGGNGAEENLGDGWVVSTLANRDGSVDCEISDGIEESLQWEVPEGRLKKVECNSGANEQHQHIYEKYRPGGSAGATAIMSYQRVFEGRGVVHEVNRTKERKGAAGEGERMWREEESIDGNVTCINNDPIWISSGARWARARASAHRARRAGSTGSGDGHAVSSVHFLTAVNGSTDGSKRGALPKKVWDISRRISNQSLLIYHIYYMHCVFVRVFFLRPARAWSPTVAGLVKRELLKDVLSAFARSKTLTKLAQDWQDVLKRASEDGDR